MPRALGLALAVAAVLAASPAADARRTPLPGLVTPSGNITCFFVPRPGHLLCGVKQAAYVQRVQTDCIARVGLDWHGWEVFAGRPTETACAGGILYDSYRDVPVFTTLPYGNTWRHAGFTCVSRRTGLTCTTGTGHGIFLSRERWRGW